jgi:hypothetical protein
MRNPQPECRPRDRRQRNICLTQSQGLSQAAAYYKILKRKPLFPLTILTGWSLFFRLCFLWGRNLIFNFYLSKLQFWQGSNPDHLHRVLPRQHDPPLVITLSEELNSPGETRSATGRYFLHGHFNIILPCKLTSPVSSLFTSTFCKIWQHSVSYNGN